MKLNSMGVADERITAYYHEDFSSAFAVRQSSDGKIEYGEIKPEDIVGEKPTFDKVVKREPPPARRSGCVIQ